jgi:hypothetical protein
MTQKDSAEKAVCDIRRKTRPDMGQLCHYSSRLNGMPLIRHWQKPS